MPLNSGSTTPSHSIVAIAASTAVPPSFKIETPTLEHSSFPIKQKKTTDFEIQFGREDILFKTTTLQH